MIWPKALEHIQLLHQQGKQQARRPMAASLHPPRLGPGPPVGPRTELGGLRDLQFGLARAHLRRQSLER
jgi:hypothetical protein